jgi:hypothetical protein
MKKSNVREYWERYVFNVGCHGPRQLHDVYNKWSDVKQEAWDQITKEYADRNGFKLSVITYCACYFTAGYMYKDGDKLMFRVHTSTDSGTMELGQNEKCDAIQHKVL